MPGGVKLIIPANAQPGLTRHADATLEVFDAALQRVSHIPVALRSASRAPDGTLAVGAEFADRSVAGFSAQVSLVYGDSARWRAFRESRNGRVGIARSFAIVVSLGTVHAFRHSRLFFAGMLRYAGRPCIAAWRALRSLISFQ
jgi:cellulose synthase (UDP-forming)